MEIINSKIQGNLLQEFTAKYLEEHKELVEHIRETTKKQLTLTDVSCSASDVISKIKHLPESDFSEEGQLKLLRVCGNALGLYKAVKWMQKHYS